MKIEIGTYEIKEIIENHFREKYPNHLVLSQVFSMSTENTYDSVKVEVTLIENRDHTGGTE